ncbi:MAG: CDP-alcohol phosphatidyltransferase [Archaeoglobus sp.]|nr:MAG: CDP-alcohol phosphatidyltransferase [Archaeoglobus sp.]
MKAVILASGQGSRMGYKLKPMLKVAGRKIIDRTIILLKPYVNEFVFVIRKDCREIEEYLERHWKGLIKYKIVKNPEPERGNGYTLLLASEVVGKDEFILTMGDHIYSKNFVEKAVKLKGLIGDFNPKYIDVSEATKVRVEIGKTGKRVKDIGKKLKTFDCLDTGFFILDNKAFEVARRVAERKKIVELSDVIRELKPEVSEVSGELWIDIDTPDDLKVARKLLVRLSIKSIGDGYISRHLNRKISTKISEYLVDYITPNQATMIAFFVGLLSSLLVFFNLPAAGILYQFSSILDGIDGEIARASLRTSKFGEWVDSILDRYVDFFFLLSVSLYLIKQNMFLTAELIIAMFALFGSIMVSYSTEKFKASYSRSAYECVSSLRYIPGKRDERIFLETLLCILNRPLMLLVLIGVLSNIKVIATFVAITVNRCTLGE